VFHTCRLLKIASYTTLENDKAMFTLRSCNLGNWRKIVDITVSTASQNVCWECERGDLYNGNKSVVMVVLISVRKHPDSVTSQNIEMLLCVDLHRYSGSVLTALNKQDRLESRRQFARNLSHSTSYITQQRLKPDSSNTNLQYYCNTKFPPWMITECKMTEKQRWWQACFHAAILLGLFDPENGGDMFCGNASWLSKD
jgi:hypothetical protein